MQFCDGVKPFETEFNASLECFCQVFLFMFVEFKFCGRNIADCFRIHNIIPHIVETVF